MVSPELIKRILQQYGREANTVLPMQTGYRSEIYPVSLDDSSEVSLILYKREPGIVGRIRNANRVGDYLAAHGFPARMALDNRIIKINTPTAQTYGALYNYLPGDTIPWEAYTMDHLKQLGATMSNMHTALHTLARENLQSVSTEYTQICTRMEAYFKNPSVRAALSTKLNLTIPRIESFQALVVELEKHNEQQPLHMDFVRGNILFTKGSSKITGILDFEKTAWGHPMFDIARTLAFLLVDCKYKEAHKVRKYFLKSGYEKRGTSVLKNEEYLEPLLNMFLTYDFYKFLVHNPYESLKQNEHYVRTCDLLLTRGCLRTVKETSVSQYDTVI